MIICPLCEQERSRVIGSHFCDFEEAADREIVFEELDLDNLESRPYQLPQADRRQYAADLQELIAALTEGDPGDLLTNHRQLEDALQEGRILDFVTTETGASVSEVLRVVRQMPASSITDRIEQEARRQRREDLVDAVSIELFDHGAPTHYTAICRFLQIYYPRLRATPGEVLRAVSDVPGIRRDWHGVYSTQLELRDSAARKNQLLALYGPERN